MDKKQLDCLERTVLRRDAEQAVEKKLDLHPTQPDEEEEVVGSNGCLAQMTTLDGF